MNGDRDRLWHGQETVPQRNQPERFRFRRNSFDKATCRVNATDEFSDRDLAAIAGSTLQVGREIFDRLPRRQPTILERQWWDDRIMDWAMRDESVKVQMFRFVDVLPMLTTSKDVVQ